MNYVDFRGQIKSGDVLAWSSQNTKGIERFVNMMIRLFTLSEYTHVGVAWVVGERIFVIEAVRPIVRIYPLSNKSPFYHLNMNVDMSEDLLTFILSKVGESYSVGQAIKSYFGQPRIDSQWQCAEFVNSFLKRAGIKLKRAWTPSALVDAVLSLDAKIQLTFVSR